MIVPAKQLGRITHARFGYGGYQDAQFGLSLTFEGPGWGVSDFKGPWADSAGPNTRGWTAAEQREAWADVVTLLRDTLKAAKVAGVSDLVGVPVEVTFDGNVLGSWRVLEEVI